MLTGLDPKLGLNLLLGFRIVIPGFGLPDVILVWGKGGALERAVVPVEVVGVGVERVRVTCRTLTFAKALAPNACTLSVSRDSSTSQHLHRGREERERRHSIQGVYCRTLNVSRDSTS